ncbi:MAG: tRNA (adenosine(37)-N6)-threonylcarbamoyltransferase complex ATPase subunit type 1 TsaE [candidate division Zixibacteria bacterium]|nr:tRNA (adenosine(37)-N6)-threonylcarbamoyltransferase complex ATPase subunit type 1 TsaE [candidate division Zixibacteria bacterium]
MKVLNIISYSEEQTLALAARLAGSFKKGDVISLNGELGSGKTVFVRGLAKALNIKEDDVSSPSFTFVNEYPGAMPVYHFDLYRLEKPSDLYEIGWDDYLGREGLLVVEWGDKAEGMLPRRYYRIDFIILSENEREINISLVET